MESLEYNPLSDIINNIINNHKQLLSTYVESIKEEIYKDTQSGLDKYNQLKIMMAEMTKRYPRIMAFLLKPKEALQELGIDKLSLQKEINTQVGGNLNFSSERLEEIKRMFNSIQNTDLNKIKNNAIEMMGNLQFLQDKLETVKSPYIDKANDVVSQNIALTNLSKFKEILNTQSANCPELLRQLSSPHDILANNPLNLKEDQQKMFDEMVNMYSNVPSFFKNKKSASGMGELITKILSGASDSEILSQINLIPIDDNMYRIIINNNLKVLENTSKQLYVLRSVNKSLDKANQVMESYIESWKVLSYEEICSDNSAKKIKQDTQKAFGSIFKYVTRDKLENIKNFVMLLNQNINVSTMKIENINEIISSSQLQYQDPNVITLKQMLENVESLSPQQKQQNIIRALKITAEILREFTNSFDTYKKLYFKFFSHHGRIYTFIKYLILKMITP